MKNKLFRNLLLLSVAIISALLGSCSKDPDIDGVAKLAAQQQVYENVDGEGQTLSVKINANCHWEVFVEDDAKEWIKVPSTTGMGDAELALEISPNKSTDPRSGIVYLISLNKSTAVELSVSQLGGSGSGSDYTGYTMPVSDVFLNQNDANVSLGARNGSINEARSTFTFTEGGMTIERRAGIPAMEYASTSATAYYEVYLRTTGWNDDQAAYIVSIPMAEALSGDLKLMFGMRTTAGAPKNWIFEWSNDYDNWYAPDENTFTSSTGDRWKYIFFNIPAEKAIVAGEMLYLKLAPASLSDVDNSGEVRFDSGLTLTTATPEQSNLPTGEKILFTEGFDELKMGGDYFLPTWYMKSADGGAFSKALYGTTSALERPGYIKLGTGSAAGVLTTPALAKLGDNKADLMVTFKACIYEAATGAQDKSAVRVTVSGAGTIDDGAITGLNSQTWTQKSVTVRNATKDTKVTFTAAGGGSRYFIDDIVIEVSGDVTPPDPGQPELKTISDLRTLKSNVATSGKSYTITDNWQITARVVSDRTAGNYDPRSIALVDNNSKASSGITVRTTAAHLYNIGEELDVVLKDAVLSNVNGALVITPSADNKISKTTAAVTTPSPISITQPQLLTGNYESMYVAIASTQVIDSHLAKKVEGDITIETVDKTEFKMRTLSSATFKADNVPQGSGTLKGVCVVEGTDVVVSPTISTDYNTMTGTRFGTQPPAPGYRINPMIGIFWNKDNGNVALGASNGEIAGNKFSFTNGYSIERTGGTSGMVYGSSSAANYYEITLTTTNWDAPGSEWLITAPCTEDVWGDLRLMFGVKGSGATYKLWKVQWSSDNRTWNDAPEEHDFSVGTYKTSFFTIPEAQKITSGNNLYLKITPTTREGNVITGTEVTAAGVVKFWAGFYVASAEAARTTFPTGENVLFTHGFDDATKGADYLLPLNHMCSYDNDNYGDAAFTISGVKQRPGYVRLGGAANSAITTPDLNTLGDTPTTITVKFKACIYKAATGTADKTTIKVDAVGAGAVSGTNTFPGVSSDQMQELSVVITGATRNTQIKFSATAATSSRYFLDDIVITKN